MPGNRSVEQLEPEDREEWRAWLEANHDTSPGIRLVTRKKNAAGPGVRYEEAVEEALAFGWIDSRVNRLDETRFLQLYTPRRPGSTWSKSNRERVARLTRAGRMAPAGLEKVKAAKLDGSWDMLRRAEAVLLPAGLARALRADPLAKKNFDEFPDSLKKGIIHWIESARREDTRSGRIREVVESARAGRRPGERA